VREWDLDVREAAAGLGFVERRQRKVFRERKRLLFLPCA
jgi:hypothetical protein